MEDLLRVGVISSTHGIRGEVKVFPTTDDAKRFKKLKEVLVETDGVLSPLQIQQVKFFKNMVILKFKGLDDINLVEGYKGKNLLVTRQNAVSLEEDEYFIADLIGMQVIDEERQLTGILQDVMPTGANDVYRIGLEDGRELLLPAIHDCVLNVDMENRQIRIHILEGLLD